MKVIRSASAVKDQACVATIGNFDGLHLGHQQIIFTLKEKAKQLNLPLTVISFEPLPAEFFMPEPPSRIYPLRDKVRCLNKLGVDNFLILNFDHAFSAQSPEAFVQNILLDRLGVRHLAVGDDFCFGHKRKGNFDLLVAMGKTAGMNVVKTATIEHSNKRVSSTRVRKHLSNGELDKANQLLGNHYQLSGRIRHGDKRGRTIGFPTLNLKIIDNIAAQRGVYAVKIQGLDNTTLHGVANLGNRPTVNGLENRLEVHVFNFDKTVYGKYICVELVKFIRPEKRFDDFDALKVQIKCDAESAKKTLEIKN